METGAQFKRNKVFFGVGTIGRDMVYSLVSMYLIYFITDAVGVSNRELLWISGIMMGARIFDALNDPFMGILVDNTRSRHGKYKPWIAGGALMSGLLTVLLFTDFGFRGTAYIVLFGIIYVLWGIAWTTNDIAYWSMMPSLSYDQKEREEIGAFARISANLGLFAVVGAVIPVTALLGEALGGLRNGFFAFSLLVVVFLLVGQSFTLFGVREPGTLGASDTSKTDIRGMLRAIFKNDQLLFTGIAMALFMVGYVTTTSFGVYYFKYAYGDEGMYPIFALVLGVSQILALAVFPWFSRRYVRRQLYSAAIASVVLGYVIFFFAPMQMAFIGAAGILLFAGQAFIQLLMLVFLADTIEYGHWKLGKRNESVSFAIQPFINKMGGAVATGILGLTLVVSGINDLPEGAPATAESITMMKSAMMILPLLLILASYGLYRWKFRLDEATYAGIIQDLVLREAELEEG